VGQNTHRHDSLKLKGGHLGSSLNFFVGGEGRASESGGFPGLCQDEWKEGFEKNAATLSARRTISNKALANPKGVIGKCESEPSPRGEKRDV